MFVIETFEAGSQPRHPPTAPLVANRIDTIKRCATAPKDRAPSPTSLFLLTRVPNGHDWIGSGADDSLSALLGPVSPKPIMAVLSNVTAIPTNLGIGRFPSNPDR